MTPILSADIMTESSTVTGLVLVRILDSNGARLLEFPIEPSVAIAWAMRLYDGARAALAQRHGVDVGDMFGMPDGGAE